MTSAEIVAFAVFVAGCILAASQIVVLAGEIINASQQIKAHLKSARERAEQENQDGI